MDYIVFDLEWNQCPDGKPREVPELPFEIIEIGAVRLREQNGVLCPCGSFHEIISPQIYRRLHWRTRSVIALNDRDLRGHRHFPEVIRDFFAWCGEDYRFCTWGTSDLPELERNFAFYQKSGQLQMASPFPFPLLYIDAQKIFGLWTEGHKTSLSLEHAVDALQLPKGETFHGALADARYTAAVVCRLPSYLLENYYSVDSYRIPSSRKEEILITYPSYTKYISRPFTDKETAMKDRTVAGSVCCRCGRKCPKKIHWFSYGSRSMLSLAWCEEHGYVKGKIRFRADSNGNVYVIKTHKIITEKTAAELRAKQKNQSARARAARVKAAAADTASEKAPLSKKSNKKTGGIRRKDSRKRSNARTGK